MVVGKWSPPCIIKAVEGEDICDRRRMVNIC